MYTGSNCLYFQCKTMLCVKSIDTYDLGTKFETDQRKEEARCVSANLNKAGMIARHHVAIC